MSTSLIPAPAAEFWNHIPNGAAVDVYLPVTVTSNDNLNDMSDMLTPAQRWSITALDSAIGTGTYYGRKYSIAVCIPSKGKPRMPIGVYALEMMAFDPEDGAAIPSGNVVYLHPDGSLRTFYGGKF